MGRKKRRQNQYVADDDGYELNEVPTDDEGCIHYKRIGDLPYDCQKYFQQRYSIFSLYNEGIRMTEDAWFGVTPEPVAEKLANHLAAATPESKAIIIDAFAGVGGNAIAFARSGRWKRVYAIEKDPQTLACAKKNAQVYGVQDLISWHEGDCFEVLPNNLKDLGEYAVVFASPPWGGPGYRSDQVFDLSQMQPYNLDQLYSAFRQITNDVALYLPRTSDLNQIAKCDNDVRKLTVMHYCMEGASKALCAFFGDLEL